MPAALIAWLISHQLALAAIGVTLGVVASGEQVVSNAITIEHQLQSKEEKQDGDR